VEALLWTKMEASLRYVTETEERCLCMQCYRHGWGLCAGRVWWKASM